MMERSHPGDAWIVLRRAVITSCVAILLTLLVASGASSFSDERQAATADVIVDVGSKRQVMQGFGSSERVWSDPHVSDNPTTVVPQSAQVSILRSLYGRLGLTRVRPVLDQGTQKQRGGSFEFQGKLGDAHIAYVKQARRFGLTTFFPGPVYLEPWIREQDAAAYADWAMAVLRRWRAAGLEPPFYAPQNEPQVNENFSPDFLRRVVIELGSRMRAAGFKTKLVVPDDENPIDAYRRAAAILADPQARKYVGAVAYHVYRIGDTSDIERMGQLAARYGLPVWMTEYTNPQYDAWPAAPRLGGADAHADGQRPSQCSRLSLGVLRQLAAAGDAGFGGLRRRCIQGNVADPCLLAHRPVVALRPPGLQACSGDAGSERDPDERIHRCRQGRGRFR